MQTFQFIFSSIFTLMTFYADKYREDDFQKTLVELEDYMGIPVTSTYDFIVVGAGAAGCVVANRLSEHFNVLLLEAGGNPPPQTNVPAFTNIITSVPSIHFEYTSVPQINASLSTQGRVRRKSGKMMGGSSSHHSFGYNRGNPLDFDNWASIVNDSSWKYENILQYFKKAERYVGSIGKGQYGLTGLMGIDDEITTTLNLWLQAGKELGFDTVDPNGPQREGFAPMPVTIENGQRVSSYTAFIKPIEKIRTNLTIIRYATVMEILVNGNKKAYGVQYIRQGFPQIAHVSKEVIICGSALASPLLLIKSGIGPLELLNLAKIPVVADLPVGQGFQDHTTLVLSPIYVNNTVKFSTKISAWTPNTIDQYFNDNGKDVLGRYTKPSQAFLISSRAKRNIENNWPDIQLVFKPGFHHNTEEVTEISIDIVLSRPRSTGFISLNTTEYLKGVRDDEKLAIVDYKLLDDVTDIEVLIEGIKFVLKLVENTTAFQSVGARFSESPYPGCRNQEFRSDDYWECFIRHKAVPWFHLAGSCSMGSVVDAKLKVIGVSGLRVIDGSVMPRSPNANTVGPVVMIGEKGSAMILEEYLR